MTFRQAQLRLLAYVVDRIHNGEFTERGLARWIGISQPHAHNVLKGIRNLSPEIFDSTLKRFNLSILDLATTEEIEANLKKRKPPLQDLVVPFLDAPVGPRQAWSGGVNWRRSYSLSLPALGARPGLVMTELAFDPYMYKTLEAADIALLDISEPSRTDISPSGLYVISYKSNEAVLRYIRPGARGLYLLTDAALNTPEQWEYLPLSVADFAPLVKARVLWVGREQDRHLPLAQRGRVL